MVGVVVVTHCHLAEEMICAAQLVVGEELKQFQPVSIDPKEGSEEIREKIIAAIRRVDVGQGVLILTDMYGGTPSNISYSFLEEGRIEVLSGVNLPILVHALDSREKMPLSELAAAEGIAVPFAAKVLMRLRRAGLVVAVLGEEAAPEFQRVLQNKTLDQRKVAAPTAPVAVARCRDYRAGYAPAMEKMFDQLGGRSLYPALTSSGNFHKKKHVSPSPA